ARKRISARPPAPRCEWSRGMIGPGRSSGSRPRVRMGRGRLLDVVSVNVGPLREVPWRGRTIRTGIFKEPAAGRLTVRSLGFDGDRQADPRVHGGPGKAVYAYPDEHYGPWRGELPGMDLPPGMFGE